ncbi:MAG TPA: hypothetical protein VFH78_08030 [Candidatus Thermoplasmatota archaeon]|nr:hypothetical protein [Candidatus Thermoplasmatota archaeon]
MLGKRSGYRSHSMPLKAERVNGFLHFYDEAACIGMARLDGDVLAHLIVAPARRTTLEGAELLMICRSLGAARAPALDVGTAEYLMLHGWRATGERDHRDAPVFSAP